jgi:hypothetical protein
MGGDYGHHIGWMPTGEPTDDDTDVVLPYQPVIELAVEDVQVGVRVAAAWAPPNDDVDGGGTMGGAYGHLIGWMPTGEPNVDDPDLVNRIF